MEHLKAVNEEIKDVSKTDTNEDGNLRIRRMKEKMNKDTRNVIQLLCKIVPQWERNMEDIEHSSSDRQEDGKQDTTNHHPVY